MASSNGMGKDALLNEIREKLREVGPELGKFMDMVESFAEDLPEEHTRYRAAMKALKQGADIDQYDILKAADKQIEKLSGHDAMMAASLEGKRIELSTFSSKAQEIEGKINKLKVDMEVLEKERELISGRQQAKEQEVKTIENSYKAVADHLHSRITGVKEKINKYLSDEYKTEAPAEGKPEEKQAEKPAAPPKKPEKEKAPETEDLLEQIQLTPVEDEEKAEAQPAAETAPSFLSSPMGEDDAAKKKPSSNKQKVCPSCSGTMDWYAQMKMWKCYVCGHEQKTRKK